MPVKFVRRKAACNVAELDHKFETAVHSLAEATRDTAADRDTAAERSRMTGLAAAMESADVAPAELLVLYSQGAAHSG